MMMKHLVIGAVAVFLLATTVWAAPITVDFSVLDTTSSISVADLPGGLTLNGVTMWYDPQGNPTSAAADQLGIYGDTNGLLVLQFATPATQLSFDFSILSVFGPTSQGAFAMFNNLPGDIVIAPGNYVPDDPSNPLLGGASYGTLSYTGPAFDQADIYFSLDGPIFTAGNITYTPVPEPATLCLLGLGAIGLLKRRRCA